MAKDLHYYKIINFKHNGTLGISNSVISSIIQKSVKDVEGVSLCVPHTIFSRGPVVIKIGRNSSVSIKISLSIDYGFDIENICKKVREKVQHDLLYMTEISPRKIDIKLDNQ